jgi:hypothetical protein
MKCAIIGYSHFSAGLDYVIHALYAGSIPISSPKAFLPIIYGLIKRVGGGLSQFAGFQLIIQLFGFLGKHYREQTGQ